MPAVGFTRGSVRALLLWLTIVLTNSGLQTHAYPAGEAETIPQSYREPLVLEPGKSIDREIAGGQTHSYGIALTSGQYLHVVVEQQGIDVVVKLSSPAGRTVLEVSSPFAKYGPETLVVIADMSGSYKLEVSLGEPQTLTGRYRVRINELRNVVPQDQTRIAAERAFREAERLTKEASAASLEQAVKKYEESSAFYKAIGDTWGVGRTLHGLGIVWKDRGDYKKSVECHEQALPILRAAGNHLDEAKSVSNLGWDYLNLADYKKALEVSNQALALLRAVGDRQWEADTLNTIGTLFRNSGENRKALEYKSLALELSRSVADRQIEGWILVGMGSIYTQLGELKNGLNYYNQALASQRDQGDRNAVASTLVTMASLKLSLGETTQAVEYGEQAIQLFRVVGDRTGEGQAVHATAIIYSNLGQVEKELEYYQRALPLLREGGDRRWEAATLKAISNYYTDLGDFQSALGYSSQARKIFETIGDPYSMTDIFLKDGRIYFLLGMSAKAIENYNQAITLARTIGNKRLEAKALGDVGDVYLESRELQKALSYYTQSLEIIRTIGSRLDEPITLAKLGGLHHKLGETKKALDYYDQALKLSHTFHVPKYEAFSLAGLSDTYAAQGSYSKAIEYSDRALSSYYGLKNRSGQAIVLSQLMNAWHARGKTSIAIYFGKQAINVYQAIRTNIQKLDGDIQKAFINSKGDTYRKLADLLISQGRLPEAQQVLGLLKEDEYLDFIRTLHTSPTESKGADLTPEEMEWERRYVEIADRLSAIGKEYGDLLTRKERTKEEEQRLIKLEKDLEVANQHFQRYLEQFAKDLGNSREANFRVMAVKEAQGLMEDLRDLGNGTVALYTVVTEDKYRVILITPVVQLAREYPISAADLNRKVLMLREALQNPRIDPRPLAQELYQIVVAPVEKDLKQSNAETLMWSLDGVLRYLPITALHDGQKYMVERYRNVVFTLASKSRLKETPSQSWKGLGLGVAKAHTGFDALPAVPEELRGIIRERTPYSRRSGILPGKVILDEAFNEATMRKELRERYPLVHIASHFRMQPGNETGSFLLLGDGTHLTLSEIKRSVNLFGGVQLLTLSACDTAMGDTRATGAEVESFGVLAQRQGAKAVIATLWPVTDVSTTLLMREFYRQRERNKGLPKVAALQRAQLALLYGQLKEGLTETQRAELVGTDKKSGLVRSKRDPQKPFAHPYYWAPFILIGNWK